MDAIANKGGMDRLQVISGQEMEIEKFKHLNTHVVQVWKKNHMDKMT